LISHFDTEALKPYKIHAHSAIANYRGTLPPERHKLVDHYELTDLKVVGVGSVGTFCAIGLFMTADAEHLFLQVKKALHSVLEKLIARPPDLPLNAPVSSSASARCRRQAIFFLA
jgi:hypothetical protein